MHTGHLAAICIPPPKHHLLPAQLEPYINASEPYKNASLLSKNVGEFTK